MDFIILINVFCIWFSWKVAMGCKPYGTAWWLNMFASALNGVIVLRYLL